MSWTLFATSVSAGTLYVSDCGDSGPNTLRGQIAAAAAGDTILFNLDCTITLTSGTLTLAQDVTIEGLGHTVIVDGNNAETVFTVNSGVAARLDHLAIQHGLATQGGGISNSGTLTVVNSTITGNRASGIGVLGLGGGISNIGTLTVTASTLSANQATSDHTGAEGGGIYNTGTLMVSNSTFAANTTNGNGGVGGGIFNTAGTATLTNSTLSTNFANGSIGQGGGIYNDSNGTLIATNTVIAGNSAIGTPAGIDGPEVYGALAVGSKNDLLGNGNSATGIADNDANHNIVGHPALLGTLADNGGPTQTFALLPGSPAIAHGDPAVCNALPVSGVDQRGVARPATVCAIGAFAPLLSAISPASGSTAGGGTVTLTGTGFAAGAVVTIGGVSCGNVHVVNSMMLTCTVPAHGAGTVDVTVTVSGVTGTLVGGYVYAVPAQLPTGKPQGGVPGSPNPLPGARSQGGVGSPSPLPSPRP